MIKQVTYYDIICDRCGNSLVDESGIIYPDKDSALMVAEQSEWITIGVRHYCPNCYEFSSLSDEYKPKNEIKYETNNKN